MSPFVGLLTATVLTIDTVPIRVLSDAKKLALLAAERDDIEFLDSNGQVIPSNSSTTIAALRIYQREDFDVLNTGTGGTIDITSTGVVYLGSETDINISRIAAGDKVRVKVTGSIRDVSFSSDPTIVSSGTSTGLILESSTGSIGTERPVSGLEYGQSYYVVRNLLQFGLASSLENAMAGILIPISSAFSTGTQHSVQVDHQAPVYFNPNTIVSNNITPYASNTLITGDKVVYRSVYKSISTNLGSGALTARAQSDLSIESRASASVVAQMTVSEIYSQEGGIRLQVNDTAMSGEDFTLLASGGMIAKDNINLIVGDNITIAANTLIQSNKMVTIRGDDNGPGNPDPGVGSNIQILGTITAVNISVYGGVDNDTILATNNSYDLTVYGREGSDTITTGDGNDTIFGDDGIITYDANGMPTSIATNGTSGGDDIIFAGNGANIVFGGFGGDSITTGDNSDIILGDSGVIYLLNGSVTSVSSSIVEGADDTLSAGGGNDFVLGGSGQDTIFGDAGDDVLLGDNGNITFIGLSYIVEAVAGPFDNSDRLEGGQGNDLLYGGLGNDSYIFTGAQLGHDTLFESDDSNHNDAFDNLDFSAFNYSVTLDLRLQEQEVSPGQLRLTLFNPLGFERVTGSMLDDEIRGNARNNRLDGLDGDDFLYGDAGNDLLLGGEGDDQPEGEDGDDALSGGSGDDVLLGGAGNDSFYAGQGSDVVLGGSGDDQLVVDVHDLSGATVSFDGGSQSQLGDSLVLQSNSPVPSVIHNFSTLNSGNVLLTGNTLISYTRLESITDVYLASSRVFSLTNGLANTNVVLRDSGTLTDGKNELTGANQPKVVFSNPIESLTINVGNLGDTLSVQGLDAGFAKDLLLNGSSNSTVRFETLPTSISGTGNLAVNAGAIRIGQNISSSRQTWNGAVTLTSNVTLASTATTDGLPGVHFVSTVNGASYGAFDLNVVSSQPTRFSGLVGAQTPLKSITTDAAGTTEINTSAVFTSGDQIYNDSVSVLVTTGLTAAGDILFSSSVANGGNTLTLTVGGTDSEAKGVVSGVGGIVKQGLGKFTLSAANTYQGTTVVNAGVFSIKNNSA